MAPEIPVHPVDDQRHLRGFGCKSSIRVISPGEPNTTLKTHPAALRGYYRVSTKESLWPGIKPESQTPLPEGIASALIAQGRDLARALPGGVVSPPEDTATTVSRLGAWLLLSLLGAWPHLSASSPISSLVRGGACSCPSSSTQVRD